MKDEIDGMTRGVVTVLENQIDAETNIQSNCRYIKIVTTICCITTLSSLACGFFWHARVQELAKEHAESVYLKTVIAGLEAEVDITKWLCQRCQPQMHDWLLQTGQTPMVKN